MPREVIVPEADRATYDAFHFAPATRAGDMVYCSGVVATYAENEGPDDIDAALTRAFESIGNTLKEAGASWDDVVDMTTYHIDMMDHIGALLQVKDRYLTEPYPSWTAIGVTRLVPERSIVEIKITAYAPR